jgi:hypothetical protein
VACFSVAWLSTTIPATASATTKNMGGGDVASKPKNSAKGKKKLVAAQQNQSPSSVSAIAAQMSYTSSICMCCGELGHHQASCVKTPMCFICKATNDLVGDCPVRKRPHQMSKYVGSGQQVWVFTTLSCMKLSSTQLAGLPRTVGL